MPRPVYSVDNPNTVLQQVEELKREVKGKGFVLTTNESVEGAAGLNTLFGGKIIPHGVTKVTCRFNYSAAMTDVPFTIGMINDYEAVFYGRAFGDRLVKIEVSYDVNGGVIENIAYVE